MKKKFLVPIIVICALTILLTLAYVLFMRPFVIPGKGSGDIEQNPNGITISTEFPVYDKSCEYVTIIIRNDSGGTAEFGSEWSLEKKVMGSWMYVPFQQNVGFNSILYVLEDGGERSDTCYISLTNGDITDGQYRIVKEINGTLYTAEFEIGESEITAESPFGYEPIGVMGVYDYDAALNDGAFMLESGENEENLLKFLEAVQMRDRESQIRLASLNEDGELLLTDIFRQRNGAYRVTQWNQDEFSHTRMMVYASSSFEMINAYSEKLREIMTTKYYSYLVTDGKQIYLSNYSEYSESEDDLLIIPAENMTKTVKEFMKKDFKSEEYDSYKIYSNDGTCSAQRSEVPDSDPLEFWMSGVGKSSTCALNRENMNNPDDAKIAEFIWQADNTLVIKTEDGKSDGMMDYYYEFRNAETFEIISYTHSAHDYVIEDGMVMIPE